MLLFLVDIELIGHFLLWFRDDCLGGNLLGNFLVRHWLLLDILLPALLLLSDLIDLFLFSLELLFICFFLLLSNLFMQG